MYLGRYFTTTKCYLLSPASFVLQKKLSNSLSDPGVPGVRSMGPDVTDLCESLTELTLADEDTNPILTDNANRAIQGNVAMQVTQPGVANNSKQCKW